MGQSASSQELPRNSRLYVTPGYYNTDAPPFLAAPVMHEALPLSLSVPPRPAPPNHAPPLTYLVLWFHIVCVHSCVNPRYVHPSTHTCFHRDYIYASLLHSDFDANTDVLRPTPYRFTMPCQSVMSFSASLLRPDLSCPQRPSPCYRSFMIPHGHPLSCVFS